MNADDYKKYGTVKSGGKKKYPIKNAKSARSALKLIGNAKPPLSSSQKSSVRSRAASFGVKPKSGSAADPKEKK
jgi:hypothetical protein